MKIDNFHMPKSSFLSMEKDMGIIVNKIFSNRRLQKLLYYPVKDALHRNNLTDEQVTELFGKHIKVVPKLYVDGSVLSYVLITFDNFRPNATNPEFRDNIISFDIICHFDQWQLEDLQLRPYKIAGEIDSMLDNQKFTGIGELHFVGGDQIILNDEFGGLSLTYLATHGEEDKKFQPNPVDEQDFIEHFKEMMQLQKNGIN